MFWLHAAARLLKPEPLASGMPLSDIQRAHVAKLLDEYCDRVPLKVRDQLQLKYRVEGYSVELYEWRPVWDDPSRWMEEPVAKFRFVKSAGRWRLYCQFSDLKWHRYDPLPEAATFGELLREVDRDPTGIFKG